MKRMKYICMGLGLILGLASCELRDELKKDTTKLQEHEGMISFVLSSSGNVNEVVSRAGFAANDVNPDLYTVRITDAVTDAVIKECTYSDLKEEGGQLKLTAGKYKVTAFNFDGSALNVSERPFFQGVTEFQVLAGKTTKVTTVCRLQNVEIIVKLSDKFHESFLPDYSITFTNGEQGVYIYTQENIAKKAYFKVPEHATSLSMTVKATTKANVRIAQSYTIKKPVNGDNSSMLAAGDSFTVTIDPGDEPSVDPVTKIDLGITVDLTMIESGITIEIPTENIVFNGDGENPGGGGEDPSKGPIVVTGLDKTYTFVSGSGEEPTVHISFDVPNKIEKLMVNIGSDNEGFSGVLGGLGIAAPFDLANPGDLLPILEGDIDEGSGIGLLKKGEVIKGETKYLFDITHFMPLLGLFGEGNHTFTITVSDGINEDVSGVLTVQVTAA